MKINNVNIDDKNEILEISKLIYKVFCINNKSESDSTLIAKYDLLYGPGYNYTQIVEHFSQGNDIFLKAIEQNKIVGVIRGKYNKIINLYVDTNQQGKGIGKKLIVEFEKLSIKNGETKIHLKSSKNAEKFYNHMGYTKKDGIYLVKTLL